jgi:hypothetical protein
VVHHVFVLNKVARESNRLDILLLSIPLLVAFVDTQKAYHCVDRTLLFRILRAFGVCDNNGATD